MSWILRKLKISLKRALYLRKMTCHFSELKNQCPSPSYPCTALEEWGEMAIICVTCWLFTIYKKTFRIVPVENFQKKRKEFPVRFFIFQMERMNTGLRPLFNIKLCIRFHIEPVLIYYTPKTNAIHWRTHQMHIRLTIYNKSYFEYRF